jgi:type VI secretion system secreted protein VgrG
VCSSDLTYGSAESTQMDAAESVAQLKAAKELATRLSDAAKAGTAHGLHSADAGQAMEKFIASIDPAKDGKHSASVNGQEGRKANGRELTDPVEAFAKPVIVLDTPSTQAWASDASIASFAGQDFSLTAQGDLHEAAAHTHATVAGETASFYTHNGGIKTFAANGPMSLKAHTDELQILADKDVTVISVNGEIHINAQSKIEIIGGNSSIVLDGGDITFTTPGTWAAKASAVRMLGGGSGSAELPKLPDSRVKLFDEQFMALDKDSGRPLIGLPYRIELPDGSVFHGTTDEAGRTQRVAGADPATIKVFWGDRSGLDSGLDGHVSEEC